MDYAAAVTKIATFINSKVDLPYVLEAFEQSLIEGALGLLVKVTPESVSFLPGVNVREVVWTAALSFVDRPDSVGAKAMEFCRSVNEDE